MAPASSGGHFVLTRCFTGFAAGVGAGALAAVTYSLVPGLSHANVRTGGIPDDFIFLVVAAFGFPAVGAIVGMLSATVCAAPHRRRGLWLGTALGTVLGLGLIGLAPFLRVWGDARPGVRGLTLYHVDWETQLHLCLLGNPGFAVLGAIVGGIVAWRPRGGRGLFTGVAGGVGVGVLAALLLSTVPGNTIVVHPAVVVCRAYAFIGFIIIGSLLRMLLLTGPKRHWFWAALPTLLLWGPALGLVSSRTVFRPQERLVGDPNLDSLTIEPHPGAGLGFRYSHGGAGDGGAYKHKKVGESGSVFSAEEYPNSLSVALVWPAPAAFEVTVDFDPGDSPHRLWVNVFGFFGTQATLDQEVVSLPVTLPPGKHRLVIKALYH